MIDRKVLESGYRFCAAVAADWACRDFAATGLTPHEIRGAWATTLSTLGNEGWELVTVLYDQEATLTDTYIFKRQRR